MWDFSHKNKSKIKQLLWLVLYEKVNQSLGRTSNCTVDETLEKKFFIRVKIFIHLKQVSNSEFFFLNIIYTLEWPPISTHQGQECLDPKR